MSLYKVGELKDGVSGLMSGTNLDNVTGLNRVLARAARKLVQKADIPEATDKEAVTLYDGVYDYPISDIIFGGALIDIQPQGVTRAYFESVQKMPLEMFDRSKEYNFTGGVKATFEHDDGVPLLRISSPRAVSKAVLDTMNDADNWTASGSIASVADDATVYYDAPKSLRFTLTGSDTGILTRTLSSTLNLSKYKDVAVAFLATRIPDGATVSDLTSIELRLGSDSSNYDSVTATQGFLGAWVAGKWLLTAFDMSASTSTGTPDWTALDYIQVRFAHTATFTNMRVGGLWLSLPSPHEIIYQTAAIFLEDGARSRIITDDDTEIVLNDGAFLLYEHECALAIAIQSKQKDKANELRNILYNGEGDNMSLYAMYRGDNPSEELRQVGSYYD